MTKGANEKVDVKVKEHVEVDFEEFEPKKNADGTVTVKLEYPVEFGDEKITHFTFKRPKAKHMMNLTSDPKFGELIQLAGKIAGYPQSVMKELDGADVATIAGVVGDFLEHGQRTGKKA